MALITPEGISHLGKRIEWADIERINIATDEAAGGTTEVWVKSKAFTGTIHPSLQDVERVKALIARNVAPERISCDDFLPAYRALVRTRDVIIRFVWLALAVTVVVYGVQYRPNPKDLFKTAIDTAVDIGPLAVLLFLSGVHHLLFIKEYWAGWYRRWRYYYLRVDDPEKIAFDHGVLLSVVGAIALLLTLAAGKWQGLVVSGLGVGALLSAKRCQSLRARENLIILTLILLVASAIAVRWTMD